MEREPNCSSRFSPRKFCVRSVPHFYQPMAGTIGTLPVMPGIVELMSRCSAWRNIAGSVGSVRKMKATRRYRTFNKKHLSSHQYA